MQEVTPWHRGQTLCFTVDDGDRCTLICNFIVVAISISTALWLYASVSVLSKHPIPRVLRFEESQ